jgi:hypothetical protein
MELCVLSLAVDDIESEGVVYVDSEVDKDEKDGTTFPSEPKLAFASNAEPEERTEDYPTR